MSGRLNAVVVSFAVLLSACGGSQEPAASAVPAPGETLITGRADIVDVAQTPAKYQSIGNCWLYATASWAESLHRTATGEEANLSESYWTYWHWFDEITSGAAHRNISTGGTFRTASNIIRSYGWMREGDFIPEEAEQEKSLRQAAALAAINASLSSGALASFAARRDAATVRAELNRAWALSVSVIAEMDAAVDPLSVEPVLNPEASTLIHPASALAVSYVQTAGAEAIQTTLNVAMSDWREVYFSSSTRRAWEQRVQRAMHDKLPVLLTWFVDFNALGKDGRFENIPATPGNQGFHMTVLEDYEVSNVPGFDTLPAGVEETRPEALEASLSETAKITFFRTKNSWGTARVDRGFVPTFAGYHDLYMNYLNGPVAQCRTGPDGKTLTTDCPWSISPLVSGFMPRSY